MKSINEQDEKKIIKRRIEKGDFELFVKYFFVKKYNKRFIFNHHHHTICDALMKVYKGDIKHLIINIAPRYSKTELAVKNFIAFSLANNPKAKFIHLSYADDLALDNSETIRDIVKHEAYQELFNVEIKNSSDSKKKWYTTQDGGVYATAAGGQVTGFGAGSIEVDKDENGKELFSGAIIIDDPIKPDDANSATVRDKINNRFDTTIKNRVNSRDTPIIIIMQRLNPNDLCGYVQEKNEFNWHVVSLPCIVDIDSKSAALWEHKHTLKELENMRATNPVVFDAQFLQNPTPKEGLLYPRLNYYDHLPEGENVCYVDVADTGSDYLCAIAARNVQGSMYIKDVFYTQEGTDKTENLLAEFLIRNEVSRCTIESNSGGGIFARNVDKILEDIRWRKTLITKFHQKANKQVRIKDRASEVVLNVYFCKNLNPIFMSHITTQTMKFTNAHDDAEDALTGLIEHYSEMTVDKWW